MPIKSNTWRSKKITVVGGVVTPYEFTDTSPNVAQVRNNGSQGVYLNYSPVVDSSNFEISIGAGITRNYGSPKPFKTLYFYSVVDCEIILNTAECDEFFPTDLDETQHTVLISGGLSNVVVDSITDALPTGTNHIGSVTLDNVTPINVDVTVAPEIEIKNDSGSPVPVSFPTPPTVNVGSISAGTNFIGRTGTVGFKALANFTRPNNTTPYTADAIGTAGDAISDSTAILNFDLSTFGAVVGQLFMITNARVVSSVKPAGSILNANIHIYSKAFTVTTDNAELSIDNTTAETGGISIPCLNTFQTALNSKCVSDAGEWMGKLDSADTKIYFTLQAVNAYIPVANEVFTVILEGVLL